MASVLEEIKWHYIVLKFLTESIAEEINGIRARSEEINGIIGNPENLRMIASEEISDAI